MGNGNYEPQREVLENQLSKQNSNGIHSGDIRMRRTVTGGSWVQLYMRQSGIGANQPGLQNETFETPLTALFSWCK